MGIRPVTNRFHLLHISLILAVASSLSVPAGATEPSAGEEEAPASDIDAEGRDGPRDASSSDADDAGHPSEADDTEDRGMPTSLLSLECELKYSVDGETVTISRPEFNTLSGFELTYSSERHEHPGGAPIFDVTITVEELNGGWRLTGRAFARSPMGGVVAQTSYQQRGTWSEPMDLRLHIPAGDRSYRMKCVVPERQ